MGRVVVLKKLQIGREKSSCSLHYDDFGRHILHELQLPSTNLNHFIISKRNVLTWQLKAVAIIVRSKSSIAKSFRSSIGGKILPISRAELLSFCYFRRFLVGISRSNSWKVLRNLLLPSSHKYKELQPVNLEEEAFSRLRISCEASFQHVSEVHCTQN